MTLASTRPPVLSDVDLDAGPEPLHRPGQRPDALPGGREHGRTTLTTDAVTRAVVEEVEGYPGVHSASARMIGDEDAPELVLEATLEDSADLTGVRDDRIEDEAVAHVRQVLDAPDLPVTVDLAVTDRSDSRVG